MKILNERIEKTIVGLATAPFTQNLAIIRISGKNTYNIIEKIFKKNGKEELLNFFDKKNKVIYGSIISDSKVIDKVIITCFFSPNSFNGEDIVEITCHGNILIVNKIINLIIKKGGVVAEKGEFTKRAVINGKINISQANSINEIIKSSNQKEIDLALHNLNFKKKDSEIDKIEKELVIIIGNIEVNIDYPEYKNFSGIENGELENKLKNFEKVLKDLKNEGIKINESKKGIKVVILGKPNVGKSTFMNNFIKEEKSIVSPIAGTTRDIIENDILIDGIPFTFLDTAGIHDSNDEIEKIGINKALFSIKDSDIIIFILDKSSFWKEEDKKIFNLIKNFEYFIIINKEDIKKKIEIPENLKKSKNGISFVSSKNKNFKSLKNKFISLFSKGKINLDENKNFFYQEWQQSKISQIILKIKKSRKELKLSKIIDLIIENLQEIYYLIKELNGHDYSEDLMEKIFKNFCLGK